MGKIRLYRVLEEGVESTLSKRELDFESSTFLHF